MGQNALGIYFPQTVGQKEGSALLSAFSLNAPVSKHPALSSVQLFSSLSPSPPWEPQLSCHPSLPAAQGQPHAQDDVLPPDSLSDDFC